jgi:quercetin dioxygenase-like cupin family protein
LREVYRDANIARQCNFNSRSIMEERRMSAGTAVAGAGVSARSVSLGPGEGMPVWFLGNLVLIKATAQTTGGAYGLFESLIPPGASPPLHVHHREDEAFWVLEGELTIRCGETTTRAPAGSYAFLPRGVPHTFVVEGDAPARLLTLVSPGGAEAFFVEGGRAAERMTMPPAGPLDLATVQRVATRFGMEFLGPPLTAASTGA